MAGNEIGFLDRIVGLARSPDREGALAHFDPDRGFGLVARAFVSLTDVVDPTIWVREKLLLAMAGPASPDAEPPLKRVLGALRAIHAELMARPEQERPWVSVMVLMVHEGEGAVVSCGDACCLRYRHGQIARLGREAPDQEVGAPLGSLGSETRVQIDVVPLHPEPGDLYLLTTRSLREGELAVVAGDLLRARDDGAALRALLEGPADRGRVAIHFVDPSGRAGVPAGAVEAAASDEGVSPSDPERPGVSDAAIQIEDLRPDHGIVHLDAESEPHSPAPELEGGEPTMDSDEAEIANVARAAELDLGEPPLILRRDESGRAAKARRLAPVVEDRPWYEPLALWVAGAFAIVALALLVRAILPGLLGSREESAPAPAPPVATGVVDLFSDPSGARVRVDGRLLEGRTPLAAITLAPGLHRFAFDWGAHGVLRDTVEVVAGEKLVLHPAIHGSLSLRSSDPARPLDVHLDGAYVGTTPLDLDDVVVGRHVIRFGAPGLAGWAQEVDVPREERVELVGNPGSAADPGSVTIRTAILSDTGFESGRGDPVWIDGLARGATPLSVSLDPGTHSVRVVRRGFPAHVSIIDVRPGGEQFVTAEFGARSEEPLICEPPPTLSRSNPLPVTVTLPSDDWDPAFEVWLNAAAPGGAFQAKRMTQLEGDSRTYAAMVPPEVLRGGVNRIRVYVRASGTTGRELHSEIVTVSVRD